jgi:hypothetical protein
MSIYHDDWGKIDRPRLITLEEQGKTRYVPAQIEKPVPSLSQAEQGLLSQAVTAASHLIANRQMSHLTKNEETPVQNAVASLIYSAVYALIAAGIAFVLAILAITFIGGEEEVYFALAILGWGVYVLHMLKVNREQGLDYSPAGIEHAEIQSREELAKFVINAHIELIKSRWEKEK